MFVGKPVPILSAIFMMPWMVMKSAADRGFIKIEPCYIKCKNARVRKCIQCSSRHHLWVFCPYTMWTQLLSQVYRVMTFYGARPWYQWYAITASRYCLILRWKHVIQYSLTIGLTRGICSGSTLENLTKTSIYYDRSITITTSQISGRPVWHDAYN